MENNVCQSKNELRNQREENWSKRRRKIIDERIFFHIMITIIFLNSEINNFIHIFFE